ncbi:competence/damage-inducible protein A [Sediminibacterium soli]|uniref:competence/damage-inducible protein A n=1 Tax=Sediminibacterium soli TaxID=2698829 RepID=UPI00137A92E0|nr:competence/damage-inducible protein A [Sediminibacterium soli]NCI46177.1 competence/damage-inducible protein A [Sediminibacterium soli]
MDKVYASIITIGDELLIGQVIDTNSAWMAQELNKIGIVVKHRIAVGDVWEDIWQALEQETQTASLILVTGGLGPTADDITKQLLCAYFGGSMIVHKPTLARITRLFETVLKRPMIERNARQAEVPDVCTVLENERGTAPGMLFERDGKIVISLPGVPSEMKWLMEHKVLPVIPAYFNTGVVRHRTLLTAGIGESYLADQIQDIEEALPANIRLAYLPNYGMVRLRLSAFGTDAAQLETLLDQHFRLLTERTREFLVIDEDIPLELAVGKLLKKAQATMATAESCTGGYIAHLVTSHEGASEYYKGSVVSYANEIKTSLLQVPEETLQTDGAVSEATVRRMAATTLALLRTDYVIAVSGIMGPGGGTAEKPVGMVWIAVGSSEKTEARQFHFRHDRRRNIEMTAHTALNQLRKFIVENPVRKSVV